MKWANIVIGGYKLPYKISDTGLVYSLIKRRLLKGSYNSKLYPYKMYFLDGKWHFIHRLVYQMFIGEIPQGYEINHKDLNKNNNSLSNLEVLTRQDNMRHARTHKQWSSGRSPGYTHTQPTRDKMGKAKHKAVNVFKGNKVIHACVSIEETAIYLNTYRKKVYRALKSGQVTKFQQDRYRLEYA